MKNNIALRTIKEHYSLPIMRKCVGCYDKYKRGTVTDIMFIGELTQVVVKYKSKFIKYRWEK